MGLKSLIFDQQPPETVTINLVKFSSDVGVVELTERGVVCSAEQAIKIQKGAFKGTDPFAVKPLENGRVLVSLKQ